MEAHISRSCHTRWKRTRKRKHR